MLNEIQKFQRNFIWGDNEVGTKTHVVAWEVVTKPKHLGGLGLRCLTHEFYLFNEVGLGY